MDVSFEIVGISCIGFIFTICVGLRLFYGKQGQLWYPNEDYFVDPNLSDSRIKFPSLSSPSTVHLSIIVPAYNEKKRLPIMLDETLAYLKKRQAKNSVFTFEIIVVDDGSKDSTTQMALEYSKRETTDILRVLTLEKNRGKGGAVKRGMLCARGQYLLMADADGATLFTDIQRLEVALQKIESDGFGGSLGSRAHLQQEAVAKRSPFRNVLMYGFHVLVNVMGVQGIKDTQCGFKLFTRKAAQVMFANLHIERWAFDVELIYLAQSLRIPLVEVAVNWKEIPGSKLTPMAASVQMGRDLLTIRACYIFKIWAINSQKIE